jgi:hypothetical protein
VKTVHRLIEDEFFDLETFSSRADFLAKASLYQVYRIPSRIEMVIQEHRRKQADVEREAGLELLDDLPWACDRLLLTEECHVNQSPVPRVSSSVECRYSHCRDGLDSLMQHR